MLSLWYLPYFSKFSENVDHRQHEGGGLAGAGLGDADQVPAHQDGRDRLALDRGRVAVAGFLHGAEQFVG
jgi:hypothetical protein